MKKIAVMLVALVMSVSVFSQNDTKAYKKAYKKYSKNIKIEVDKFDKDTTYETPFDQIKFIKTIKNNKTTIYMSISTIGSIYAMGKKVLILLDNGEIIEKTDDIDIRVNNNGDYEYSTFIRLSNLDINLLKKYNITDTKLYIFDMKIKKPLKYKVYMDYLDEI